MSNETFTICQASEEFKSIPGFENYAVSNHGRVMRITAGSNCEVGLIKNVQINKKTGYCHVKVSGSLGRRTMSLHRLVAEVFIPNPEELKELDHIDRNKQNNCVENLRWCTRIQNMSNLTYSKAVKNIWAYPPDGGEPIFFLTAREAARYISRLTGLVYFPQGIANVLNNPKYSHYKGWKFKYASTER